MLDDQALHAQDDTAIDLGRHVRTIARRWRLVCAVTLLTSFLTLGGWLWMSTAAPQYQAQSSILLTGAKYRLQLDPKFTTVDSALAARADEIQVVATGADVMAAAADQMAQAAGTRDLGSIDVKVRSNVVSITATSRDPDRAATAARVVAQAAAARLDGLYGLSDADAAALKNELASTTAAYNAAETALATFIREDSTSRLTQQVEQKELALKTLTSQQNSVLRSRLAVYYQASDELDRIKRDAEALRGQITEASRSQASLVAQSIFLLNLQTRLAAVGSIRPADEAAIPPMVEVTTGSTTGKTTISPGSANSAAGNPVRNSPPAQLQLSADALLGRSSDPQQLLADVDALASQAAKRQTALRDEFARTVGELEQRVNSGDANLAVGSADPTQGMATRLTNDIQSLKAQIQDQQHRLNVLTQDLDNARTARTTIDTKIRESNITAATSGGKAVPSVPAPGSVTRVSPMPLIRTLPFAIVAGLVLGCAGALAMEAVESARRRPSNAETPAWPDHAAVGEGALGD